MKVAVPLAKKYSRNYSSYFSNWCRNSKENTWFRDNNFNNFKRRNEWHNENCSSSWRFQYFKKRVTKTIGNGIKEQKGEFLGMLLGTLGASLLGSMLSGKGIVRAGSGNKKGKGIARAVYGNEMDF